MLWKKIFICGMAGFASLFIFSSCGTVTDTATEYQPSETSTPPIQEESQKNKLSESEDEDEQMLTIKIGTHTLHAVLESNPSAQALKDLLGGGPILIDVQNYGGFEKVGTLPQSLPRDDAQMTASPGDIMLYQGNSIVFFYGSNSWAYTKLGTISDYDQKELREILSGNDTVIELSVGN